MDEAEKAPRGRGRPPHEPTAPQRAKVEELARLDADVATIAEAIGVSEPTLRQYYAAELVTGRPQLGFGFVAEDLGEAPARELTRGGRPPHEPSDQTRNRVEILAAASMFDWQIAAALGITVPTLKLHYDQELLFGASRKKSEMIEAMFDAGKAGKVAAQKAYIAMCQELGDERGGAAQPAEAPKEPKLGKKEQQLAEAREPDRGSTLGALMAQRLGHPGDKLN